MPTDRNHYERSLSPPQRATRALLAGIDARHDGDSVRAREWRSLRARLRAVLAMNAHGSMSAADVVAYLYAAGYDQEPGAVTKDAPA